MIDVVLTYVDGSAAGYRELHERHAGPLVPCQTRTLGELRYALRSLDLYASWLERVHLVVQSRAHLPAWLDERRVRVVLHEDYLPPEALPALQVFPIQACLHRIPGLSERVILWEDDHFLGRPARPGLFFYPGGRPRTDVCDSPVLEVLRLLRNPFVDNLLASRRLLGGAGFLYPHMPLPVLRSEWEEMVRALALEEWLGAKTRGKLVLLEYLYPNWSQRRRPVWRRWLDCLATRLRPHYGIYKFTNDARRTARELARLERRRPRLFCINDDAYEDPVNPVSRALLQACLARLYPRPSRFEL